MTESEPLPLSDEDRARADCYGLISRVFYAAPDADLLKELSADGNASAAEPSELQIVGWEPPPKATPYSAALQTLQDASRNADPATLKQDYDDLFAGAGKALVTPYTSGYTSPNAPDRYLVALREHLIAWGLVRKDAVFELEDHVSAVCDVMRWLIERERPLEEQLTFFNDFVYTGVGTFCDAIEARATTPFYRAVSGLAREFLKIERDAFHLESPE